MGQILNKISKIYHSIPKEIKSLSWEDDIQMLLVNYRLDFLIEINPLNVYNWLWIKDDLFKVIDD
jgi:hypothetical protein